MRTWWGRRFRLPGIGAGLVVFAVGFAVRIWLIHDHPAMFGGDTVLRLANRDRILLAYQLPLLQTLIWAVSQVTGSVLAVRYVMAAAGALAGVGFLRLAEHFVDRRAALWVALLAVTNPFLVELSMVPYQEVPMLAALLFAFHFFFAGKIAASSLSLALACFTRYEAWAAGPVLAVAYAVERGRRPIEFLKGCAWFGWAPLAWMICRGGVSPAGTFVIEAPKSAARLMRYVYLGWITAKNTPAPVLLLAIAGTVAAIRKGWLRDAKLRALLGYLALFLFAVLFSAHGESPDPERFVTAREATLLIAAVTLAAAFAPVGSRVVQGLAVVGLAWCVFDAHRFVVRDTSLPRNEVAWRLARYLDSNVRDGERVLILTAPIPPELMRAYIEKAAARGGERGVTHALKVLTSMDASPPDFQRTVVQMKLRRERVSNVAADPAPQWFVIWSDFLPSNPREDALLATLLKRKPGEVIRAGGVEVKIWQAESPAPPAN